MSDRLTDYKEGPQAVICSLYRHRSRHRNPKPAILGISQPATPQSVENKAWKTKCGKQSVEN